MKLWRAAAPTILERRFLAMGTEISVKLVCVSKTSREDAEAAITEVQQLMADFGRDWWAWGPGALAEINRQLVAGEVVRIPPNMQPLFNRAWSTRQMTEGFFEPRIAALVRLWGFDDVARLRSEPPAKAQIDALLHALKSAPAYAGGDQYGPAPDVAWDFGGIGKGYIIDVALAHLQARGFSDAVVDAGGNLAVRGAPLERSWRIGIRDPRSNPEHPSLLAALDVRDEAVITHGDDQRYFDYAGRRYAHILNPLTGSPVQGLCSITVVHPEATRADAEGAALFVAGDEAWPRLAKKLGLSQVFAVSGDGRVRATAAVAERLQLVDAGRQMEILP
jgi:thiamine biosynthesis lipoprotein